MLGIDWLTGSEIHQILAGVMREEEVVASNTVIRRRPPPPKDSWWVGVDREEFNKRAEEAAQRMHGYPDDGYANRKWGSWKAAKERQQAREGEHDSDQ